MKTKTLSLKKWLLLLAMALVGCQQHKYQCSIVQSGMADYHKVYGDSINMITSHHAIVYRNGIAINIRNDEVLEVECRRFK